MSLRSSKRSLMMGSMPRSLELTGQTFGRWLVLRRISGREWMCRCHCGIERTLEGKRLTGGRNPGCGDCRPLSPTKLKDAIGIKFGRLTVQERIPSPDNIVDRRPRYRCLCDCGKLTEVTGRSLRSGKTKSCGCLSRERVSMLCRTQGGLAGANWPTYVTWYHMIARCEDHPNYAGRGIVVCDRWKGSFAAFLEDMGPRPSRAYSIERVDNDGNYEPGNCRWATRHEQARNTRGNHLVTIGGRRMIVTDWAKENGIGVGLVYNRTARGWTIERALTQPPRYITKTPLYQATRRRAA